MRKGVLFVLALLFSIICALHPVWADGTDTQTSKYNVDCERIKDTAITIMKGIISIPLILIALPVKFFGLEYALSPIGRSIENRKSEPKITEKE